MVFHDNVLKEYLKNVFFITGTPCGGKTTVSRELAKRYGLLVYDVDDHFSSHQAISNPIFQPAMNQSFPDADAFFGRSVEDYTQWLRDNSREQLEFALLDLIRLSQNQIVLCDCHLTIADAEALTLPSRIAFLVQEPSHLIDDYCSRPDHQAFCTYINSASEPESAKATCNAALEKLNRQPYELIKSSSYFWIDRSEHCTIEETVKRVAEHFQLAG